jgi:hypothetical protein
VSGSEQTRSCRCSFRGVILFSVGLSYPENIEIGIGGSKVILEKHLSICHTRGAQQTTLTLRPLARKLLRA